MGYEITITRDGEAIAVRSVSADIVVAFLVADTTIEEKPQEKKPKKEAANRQKGKPRECCGSLGPRHKIGCPEDNSVHRTDRSVLNRIVSFIEEGETDASISDKCGVSTNLVRTVRKKQEAKS